MKLDEQYILYALGELEPEEEKEIELQLQQNPELMAEVEKIRQTDGLLADVFAQSDEYWAENETTRTEDKAVSCDRTNLASRLSLLASHKTAWRALLTLATLILIAIGGVIMFFPAFEKNQMVVYSPSMDTMVECSPAVAPAEYELRLPDKFSHPEDKAVVEVETANEETVTFNAVDLSRHESKTTVKQVKPLDSTPLQEEHVYSVPALEEVAPVPEAVQIVPEPETHNETVEFAGPVPATIVDISEQDNDVVISNAEEESDSNGSEYDPIIALLLDSEMFKNCLDQVQQLKVDNPLKDNAVLGKIAQQYSATKKQVLYGLFCSCIQDEDLPQIVLQYFGLTVPDMTKRTIKDLSKDERFALAVVRFIEIVRKPKLRTAENFKEILTLLSDSVEKDGKRLEFKTLVEKAMSLKKTTTEKP